MSTVEKERLQKLLARAGYGSRREIEGWIKEGQLSINGEVAKLGDHASAEDEILRNGEQIPLSALERFEPRVIAYYKPEGQVCTRDDPEGRDTVFNHLPTMKRSRWVMIGRLDINTQGLLLFTNDGELANKLMHPSQEIEREYAVRVYGEPSDEQLKQLVKGVMLEDGPARFKAIELSGGEGKNRWYHVILTEGRNREVRRLWESIEVTVSRLVRIRYGSFVIDRGQKPRQVVDLAPGQMKALYKDAGLPFIAAAPKTQDPHNRRFKVKKARTHKHK